MNAETEPRDGLNDEAPDSDGKLGVAKTARFLQPFTTELGTCTEDRRELLTDRTLADVLDEARRRRTNRNESPSARVPEGSCCHRWGLAGRFRLCQRSVASGGFANGG
jgi:hypothetical protein